MNNEDQFVIDLYEMKNDQASHLLVRNLISNFGKMKEEKILSNQSMTHSLVSSIITRGRREQKKKRNEYRI